MKESIIRSYDELPLFLNAATAAKLLGVSISSMYELMHEKGFPLLRIAPRDPEGKAAGMGGAENRR